MGLKKKGGGGKGRKGVTYATVESDDCSYFLETIIAVQIGYAHTKPKQSQLGKRREGEGKRKRKKGKVFDV